MKAMVEHQQSGEGAELIQAAVAGDVQAIRSALAAADVNAADGDGWTALHVAVHGQHGDLTRLLLEHPDIDVNSRNKWGSTPLMLAAGSGNLDIVECLLRHPKTMVDLQAEYYGRTALIESAVKGHAHIARCLVSHGANVNISDKTGRNNALIEAIKNKHADIAIYLLRTGTIDFSNRDLRLQALIWARRRGDDLNKELDHAIAAYFDRTGGRPEADGGRQASRPGQA
ncbi:MAG: ankyrin repeat domain-containing protein [Boseongicola sp. SB0675_bin_26]|nr:ankyrin repeat domain-containing protein [Boseongicola sp. SB0675_bin_26]